MTHNVVDNVLDNDGGDGDDESLTIDDEHEGDATA